MHTLDEALQELRAALDADHPGRIVAAQAQVDRLDVHPGPVSLLSAALWYAEQGLRIFPLSPGTKIPYRGSNGCHGASSNLDVVEGWWTDSPDANIGIATGHLIDVVDIDGAEGQKSRASMWDSTFAQIDADCLAKVLTPRPGGMHIYIPATGVGNKAGIAPSVDVRGAGGYVVAPPSVITEGPNPGHYRFLGEFNVAGLTQDRKVA